MQFTWKGSSADWSDAAAWNQTNPGASVPGAGDDATIDASGSAYTVGIAKAESVAVANLVLGSTDGTLALNGTLAASGTVSLQAGTLALAGTLADATIEPGGATVSYENGTLANVSFDGPLTVAEGGTVGVEGTLGLLGGGGGALDLQGASSTVTFLQSATLDNATVDFGGVASTSVLSFLADDGANTLTLGPHLLAEASDGDDGVIQNAAAFEDNIDLSPGNLVNAGTLSADAGGIIDVLANSFINTGTIIAGAGGTVDLDAYEIFTQAQSFSTVDLGGLVEADGGTVNLPLYYQIPVTGTGTVEIGAAGAVVVAAAGGTGLTAPTFDFAGTGGTLVLQTAQYFNSTVENFAPGDTIEAAGTVSSVSYANGDLLFDFVGVATPVAIAATGAVDYATAQYAYKQVADGGGSATDIGIACYCAGTRIATPDGEVAVEALRPGAMVLTWRDGVPAARAVRWVGRLAVDLDRHPAPWRAAPIRIFAHAFAPGAPRRDLLVSPDHAVLVGDVLIQAQSLVNGATIVREPAVGRITYWHVELDQHALLLAEGLPAESYLDTGERGRFDGEAGARPLFADFSAARAWDGEACAPLVLTGPKVAAAQARLLRRARRLGHRLTGDVGLRLFVDELEFPLVAPGPLRASERRASARPG